MGNELAVRSAFDIELNSENLEMLAAWVSQIASPENLAWDSDRFKDLRNLLRTRKAAADLRIQAVKIECIALRRIGLAGLADKLKYENKKIALQLAEMSEEDFSALMDDCDNQYSPASFLRSIDDEKEWRQRYYGGRQATYEIRPDLELRFEFRQILEMLEGPFTVQQAADELFLRLEKTYRDQGTKMPRELADEPLREVVRAVLRSPDPGSAVYIGANEITVPEYVTYDTTAGWYRVSWREAILADFKSMVALREKQAAEMIAKAESLRLLFDAINSLTDDPSMSVDACLIELFKRGVVSKKREEQNA
jgi:hypothetical protein